MHNESTYQDAPTTPGEVYGHRVKVAVCTACVGDGGDDGEDAEDAVEEDSVRGHGRREGLHSLSKNIVNRHPRAQEAKARVATNKSAATTRAATVTRTASRTRRTTGRRARPTRTVTPHRRGESRGSLPRCRVPRPDGPTSKFAVGLLSVSSPRGKLRSHLPRTTYAPLLDAALGSILQRTESTGVR